MLNAVDKKPAAHSNSPMRSHTDILTEPLDPAETSSLDL